MLIKRVSTLSDELKQYCDVNSNIWDKGLLSQKLDL